MSRFGDLVRETLKDGRLVIKGMEKNTEDKEKAIFDFFKNFTDLYKKDYNKINKVFNDNFLNKKIDEKITLSKV